MLSKTERDLLNGLLDLVAKYEKAKSKKKELSNEKALYLEIRKNNLEISKNKQEIDEITEKTRNYITDYFKKFKNPSSYKRVFKHRLKKKANCLMDDLILILKTYEGLGILDKELKIRSLFSINKYSKLKHLLPEDINEIIRVLLWKDNS